MIMISEDSDHEIIAVNGEMPEDFIGKKMDSDGDSSHAGVSTLTHFSLVLTSIIWV
jgi:hypothetical protein